MEKLHLKTRRRPLAADNELITHSGYSLLSSFENDIQFASIATAWGSKMWTPPDLHIPLLHTDEMPGDVW